MGCTVGAEPGGIQRSPLAAGAQYKENGIHGLTIITARPMAPQGMWLAWREQRDDALPQRLRNMPITVALLVVVRHQ